MSVLTFVFTIDTQNVDLTGRIQILEQGDLLIAAVRETDAGKYTCIRANEAGQVQAAGYLSVLGKYLNQSSFYRVFLLQQCCNLELGAHLVVTLSQEEEDDTILNSLFVVYAF